jgi:hypothetical protein
VSLATRLPLLVGLALAAAACAATPPPALPTDLPPPEYEAPRGLDLTPKKAAPAPSAAPPAPAQPPP